jgi:hypothetical protein
MGMPISLILLLLLLLPLLPKETTKNCPKLDVKGGFGSRREERRAGGSQGEK